jgi:hypothetical protein
VLYTGDGSTSNVITTGLKPDFVWFYERNSSSGHHNLYDTVRGASKVLYSNLTSAQATSTGTQDMYSFNSTGFTVGSNFNTLCNTNGEPYISWNWKAGGTASSNSDGSITSLVSANTTAGFSIVSYTGHGSTTGTVGHGLGVKPDLIITKYLSGTASWAVYNSRQGATKVIFLDDTSAEGTGITYWRDTEPTASVFSVGASGTTGGNANPYIAYCFASIEGYSKVGSYTGNNNADGPFIYTGFRPAWVMVKSYSAGGTHYDWPIYDSARSTYNAVGNVLEANQDQAEITGTGRGLPIDFLSNGFKHRSSYGENNSTPSYIYLAFAESPFKTANAR